MHNSSLKAKWDYENSIAFAKEEAEQKGREKEQFKVVTNLIMRSDWSDEQIANIVEVPVSFVMSVRNGLKG